MKNKYHQIVMPFDPRRDIVWKEVTKVLQTHIPQNSSVLDLGAGHCHFINNIKCREKYAFDIEHEITNYAASDVNVFIGDCSDFSIVGEQKFDVVFVSNLLEHFERNQIIELLEEIRKSLNEKGKLIILQPNYRYAYREYFDDFTHITPFDHVSLKQALLAAGFKTIKIFPKFLPYSMDSKLPVFRWLVYLYLRFPIKPLAKQMLGIAET